MLRMHYKVDATLYGTEKLDSPYEIGIIAGLYPDLSTLQVMDKGSLDPEYSSRLIGDDWDEIYKVGVFQLRGMGAWSGSDFPYAGEPVCSIVNLPTEPFQAWPTKAYIISGHTNIVVPIDTSIPPVKVYWWASLKPNDENSILIEYLGPFSELDPDLALIPDMEEFASGFGTPPSISIEDKVWYPVLFVFAREESSYRVYNEYRAEVPVPGAWYEALRKAKEIGGE